MNNTKPEGLDLTELLKQIIEHNGAPLFDVAIQVDDRNTSRYVLSIGLPRHSGIMPQFYSNMPKVSFNLISSFTRSTQNYWLLCKNLLSDTLYSQIVMIL